MQNQFALGFRQSLAKIGDSTPKRVHKDSFQSAFPLWAPLNVGLKSNQKLTGIQPLSARKGGLA